jgi:hypothetical protein
MHFSIIPQADFFLNHRLTFCYCSLRPILWVNVMVNLEPPKSVTGSLMNRDTPSWPGDIAPAPLLPGEDEAGYARLSARFLATVKPRDFIEELLVRDAIDLTWEILRLRRLKAGLLRAAGGEGVRSIAGKLGLKAGPMTSLYDFSDRWMSGDTATRRVFEKLLKTAGLTTEDVMAEALSSKIDTFERIDRMLASSEARRNNALREVDRHRAALGGGVRQAIDEVQDAEFRDVETSEESGGPSP